MLTNQLLSVIKYPEAAKMNSPTRGWLEQILCSKRIPSKSKSILSTALTTAAKLALLFYSVNYTQLTSHLGPLFFRDNFMDRCVLACWCAALCWWSKKTHNEKPDCSFGRATHWHIWFSRFYFYIISQSWKHEGIMREKNYRAKDREEQKEKARCVFFKAH